jgi:hypothetical protein
METNLPPLPPLSPLPPEGAELAEPLKFLSRRAASLYLTKHYFPTAVRTLAKLAVEGGGPVFRKAGAAVLYERKRLDQWALAKITGEFKNTTKQPTSKPRGRPRKSPALSQVREAL